jgi:hypothetical protein
MLRATLAIAGVRIDLGVAGPLDVERHRARFDAYQARRGTGGAGGAGPEGAADASLLVFIDRSGKLLEPPEVPYPGVKVYASTQGTKMLREGLSLWVDNALRAEAFVTGPEKMLPAPETRDAGPVDTPLRIVTSLALLRSGRGALMHAAGYADGRGGLLFVGPGGAGKTTLSRMLPEGSVLSDDQVALVGDGAPGPGFALEATPFVGMLGRPCPPQRARLRAIVVLDQRLPGVVASTARHERSSTLLACLPLYARARQDALAALALVDRVASSVPVLRGSPSLAEGSAPWLERIDATLVGGLGSEGSGG